MCTCQRSGVAYPRNQCSTDQCFLHFRKRTHLIFFFSLHGRRVSYHTVSVISIRGPYFLEVIEEAASHPRVENRSWAVVLKESPPGLNRGEFKAEDMLQFSYPFLPTPTSLHGMLPIQKKWKENLQCPNEMETELVLKLKCLFPSILQLRVTIFYIYIPRCST